MSDHLPINVLLKDQKKCTRENKIVKTHALTNTSLEEIKTGVTNTNWKDIL